MVSGWRWVWRWVAGSEVSRLQLQWRAFADGASAFARLAELPRIERTVQVTVVLALCSSALAVVLGMVGIALARHQAGWWVLG